MTDAADHSIDCPCQACDPAGLSAGEVDDAAIEVCTNCGGYFTPRPGQDYFDTRCSRCGGGRA